MLTLMLMLTTPAYTVPPGLAVLAGLQGCWRVSGQVQGKDSPSIARGEWHLGRRYFTLHLRATGSDPYEAAITYGAGERPQAIGSVFSDTFGGLYEPSLGLGELEQGGFVQRYRFSDATYLNRFTRSGTGWLWTITEQTKDKPPSVFADYQLAPSPMPRDAIRLLRSRLRSRVEALTQCCPLSLSNTARTSYGSSRKSAFEQRAAHQPIARANWRSLEQQIRHVLPRICSCVRAR